MTPERTEQRMREAGWTTVPSDRYQASTGSKTSYFSATRGPLTALVAIYDYNDEGLAEQTERALRKTEGAAVERDGGRVLSVLVHHEGAQSRKLLDDLVR